jgi:CxxC motif-containing protein
MIKTILTIIAVLVIMSPYLIIKFVCNPIGCIKQMRANWKFVYGDSCDYPSLYCKDEEKKTKR